MSVASPITTLAGHIAALQAAGAVAIWPLDDAGPTPVDYQFREASGEPWVLLSGGGQPRVGAGPYGELTAYQPLSAPVWDPQGAPWASWLPWPPSFQEPQLSICFWLRHPGTPTGMLTVDCEMEGSWGWNPFRWGWGDSHAWAVLDWPWYTNVLVVDPQTALGFTGRWFHVVAVIDSNQGRLYLDGELYGGGPLTSPLPSTRRPVSYRHIADQPGGIRMQALALFDRALTDQEVRSLHYGEAPPVTAPTVKVWNGSQWVEGVAKGWDGNQWRQAKIWTGEDWR